MPIKTYEIDDRRKLEVPGGHKETVEYCTKHFLKCGSKAINDHGSFFVALSGGSTPKSIFKNLATDPYKEEIDWSKVYLFWSDERSVEPTDHDSNYKMAMDAGMGSLGIPKGHIFRMEAETDIEEKALEYEKHIHKILGDRPFDLVMLGMGDDGHTASLFPETEGLNEKGRWCIANFIPDKKTWRMTLTYPCINHAKNIAIYVLGDNKKHMLKKVLKGKDIKSLPPSGHVGTKDHPALWIADDLASNALVHTIK